MRNLKKLLAVIVAICILATFTVPAFAAESFTYETQAKSLYDMKLFAGNSASEYVPALDGSLTREQGIILLVRLFGKEADAKAFADVDTALAAYTDADKVSTWAKNYVAYAVKNGMVVGETTTTLNAPGKLIGNAFATMILRNLGYTVDSAAYATAAASLQTKLTKDGLLSADTAAAFATKELIRDDAVGMMFASLVAKDTTDKTPIAKLVDAKIVAEDLAVAAGIYTSVPATPEVVSASADNLKVAKIVFNKEIDAATVTKTTVKASGILDVKLGDDKKTVYAIMPQQKQSTTLDFTIDGVKDLAGTAVGKTVKAVTFADVTFPVISGAVAKNAKTIELIANEPIAFEKPAFQVLNNIKIDGIAIIAKATPDYVNNTVILELSSLLKAGTHKIDISDLTDYSTLKAVAATYNIEVVADTTAPVMIDAKVNNINEIEVTFDEIVDAANQGSFKVNGDDAGKTQVAEDKSKFKLTLAKPLTIGAVVEIKIEYKDQKDVVGNKTASSVYTFKVADDTTLPTVSAAIDSSNKITLVFSKTMQTAGTIKVLKSDKTVLGTPAISFKADTNNTVIEISSSASGLSEVDPMDIKVSIAGMKDATIRSNSLPDQSIDLKANDTKKPTVTGTYLAKLGDAIDVKDDTITFYFSEAMDVATLNNLSNYVLEGATAANSRAFSSIDGVKVSSVAADGKSVTIVYPNIAAEANKDATFTVYALKDIAGNPSIPQGGIIKLTATAMDIVSVTATAGNKIVVEFNTNIASIDPSVFAIKKLNSTTGEYDAHSVFVDYAVDGKKATFTANNDLGTEFGAYKLAFNNYTLAVNIYGSKLTGSETSTRAITDKVGPKASVAAATTAGAIAVSFSEDVTVASASTLLYDVIVRKADGALVNVTTSQVTFWNGTTKVAETAAFDKIIIEGLDSAKEYTVEIIPRSISDAFANKVATLAATSVTTK